MSDDKAEAPERDFLAEAQQSAELARAMAQISSLTASATASLASLEAPMSNTSDAPPPQSFTSSSRSEEEDYPDMSKYYSGSDYAASLPDVGSWSSGYATGSLFTGNTNENEKRIFPDVSSSPLLAGRGSATGGSVLKRCYLILVVVFVALLVLDQFQPPAAVRHTASADSDGGVISVKSARSADNSRVLVKPQAPKAMDKISKRARKAEKDAPLKKLMVFGRHGASPGRFDQPRGLLLVRNRFLFVSDFANKRIQMLVFHDDSSALTAGGSRKKTASRKEKNHHHNHHGKEAQDGEEEEAAEPVFEYALEMDQVGGPWSLCALGDFVFVAEWGMHRIQILKIDAKMASLKAVGVFGQFGYADEPGKFNHPRGIAVSPTNGFIVVSDENDHLQVLKFTDSAKTGPVLVHVSSFGRGPDASAPGGVVRSQGRDAPVGFFRRPTGVAIHADSGLVFVADAKNHRLQTLKLTSEGQLQPVAKFGTGSGFSFRNEPEAISLHPTHPLLVVTEQASQCLHEIMINPGGHLSLRRSHCGKLCSSSVSGSGGVRISGSRAPGPTSALLVKDLVMLTAGDQVILLKWKDWVVA